MYANPAFAEDSRSYRPNSYRYRCCSWGFDRGRESCFRRGGGTETVAVNENENENEIYHRSPYQLQREDQLRQPL